MTLMDEFKKELLAAGDTSVESGDEYLDIARKIVNVERQSFYGEENSTKRLSRIRELISEAVKKEVRYEIQES